MSEIFVTASYDHQIKFWKQNTGVCHKTITHNVSQINCMAIHPDRNFLAAGGFQHFSIYDIANQNMTINVEQNITKNTVAMGFDQVGNWMYTAGEDKILRIWDTRFLRAQKINFIQAFNHTHPITSVALHPNQNDFYIGDEVGNLFRWDIRSNHRKAPLLEPKSAIRSISINQEGTLMAAVNNEGSCFIWMLSGDFREADPILLTKDKPFQPHQRYALKCLFSPDSTLLATSSADGTAKIWRTVDRTLHTECKDNHQKWVWDLAFTNDSQYLFTASSDNMARLWSVQTGEIKKDYVGHQKPVVCLAYMDPRRNI